MTRRFLSACLLTALAAAPALAQTTAPRTPKNGPPPGSSAPVGLDLPLAAPTFAGAQDGSQFTPIPVGENVKKPDPKEVLEPPEGEDPRDTPAPTIYGEELMSENDTILYVLDTSGSMGGDKQPFTTMDGNIMTGSRLDRAKAELIKSISGLSMNFRFNIIRYDCVQARWSTMLKEASDPNKQASFGWINALDDGSGTGTGPAVALALGDKDLKLVVLLTDGRPNCGASGTDGHRTMISTNNTQGATINVFGIGTEGDARAFCQAVSADSGGAYFDVP